MLLKGLDELIYGHDTLGAHCRHVATFDGADHPFRIIGVVDDDDYRRTLSMSAAPKFVLSLQGL
jgi:hypothetical protein